jgi:spore coat polysaccharide biosynthesis predicted glycosyltransferase SpsG
VKPAPVLDLLLRADATPDVGAGHVMRCATLAHAWRARQGGAARVWGTVTIPFVSRRLAELGVEVAARPGAPRRRVVVVVDSYDDAVRAECAAVAGARLRVLVDDVGEMVPAGYDAVWNPNPFGAPALYPRFAGAVLAGPECVPVRPDLPSWHAADPRRGAAPERAAVVLGGGDAGRTLAPALERLADRCPELRFVGVGSTVPDGWERVDAHTLWADVARRCGRVLTAAGSSLWEAAFVGIPTAVVVIAANQRAGGAWVAGAGVPVVDATPHLDPAARTLPTPDVEELADALTSAIRRATPLPRLVNGAPSVAAEIVRLASADPTCAATP